MRAVQRTVFSALAVAIGAVLVGLFWSDLSDTAARIGLFEGKSDVVNQGPASPREGLGANMVQRSAPSSSPTPESIAANDADRAVRQLDALEFERDLNKTLLNEIEALRSELTAKSVIADNATAEVQRLNLLVQSGGQVSSKPAPQEADKPAAEMTDMARTPHSGPLPATAQASQDLSVSKVLDEKGVQSKVEADQIVADVRAVNSWQKQVERALPSTNNPDLAKQIARAAVLVGQGNINAARAMLDRAVESGDAQANFMLAETYDPNVLAKWGAKGTQGELDKARLYYAKAYAGNVLEAKDRLNALRH